MEEEEPKEQWVTVWCRERTKKGTKCRGVILPPEHPRGGDCSNESNHSD